MTRSIQEDMASMIGEYYLKRYENGALYRVKDVLVAERRVVIMVCGNLYAELLATPTDLEALAAGFLFSEGVIKKAAHINGFKTGPLSVDVELNIPIPPIPDRARSSGFGLGTVALDDPGADKASLAGLKKPAPVKATEVTGLMAEFNDLSRLFKRTGSIHSAWLVAEDDRFFAEDVGRHNALDKAAGFYLLSGRITEKPPWVLASGRITGEMVFKTAKIGAGVLISRGAASARALSLARKFGLILLCFARGHDFNILNGMEFIS